MKIKVFAIVFAASFGTAVYGQSPSINSGFGLGMQLVEYQNDFGLGLNLTSPLLLNDHLGFRLKGNMMFNQAVIDGKSDWVPYSNISLGMIGIGGLVSEQIRLYGEGGVIAIFPSGDISTADQEFGGYGLFGFEFFFYEGGNYFIEIGGVGTGAQADRLETEPIYSNGLSLSAGFRFFFN